MNFAIQCQLERIEDGKKYTKKGTASSVDREDSTLDYPHSLRTQLRQYSTATAKQPYFKTSNNKQSH